MKKCSMVIALICAVLLVNCTGITASAAYNDTTGLIREDETVMLTDLSCEKVNFAEIFYSGQKAITRATSRIEWTIPADTVMKLKNSYSLEADELVTINCTYSPRTADIDFGLISSDGLFHYLSESDGNIRTTIQINDTGENYFAVRNNTKRTIEVLGYVYY